MTATKNNTSAAPIGVWFPQGFANLYQAQADLRRADTTGRYRIIGSHPHPEFVGLQSADVALVEPTDAREFKEFALMLVREHNVRVIVPSRRQAFFNKNAKLFADLGVAVLTVADNATKACIEDKLAFYRYLKPLNLVNVPEFEGFTTLAEFDAAYSALTPRASKVCIKPAYGVYGSGFRVLAERKNGLQDLLNESLTLSVAGLRERLGVDAGPTMLLMQYLDGDERSVDCLAKDGVLVAAVCRRKSNSPIAGQVIEDRPDLVKQVQNLTEHLKLNGLFNVQFKDHDGVPFLLEINPRMSGRSYYATAAGCNLPYLAAELFSGAKAIDELSFSVNFGLRIGNLASPMPLGLDKVQGKDGVNVTEFKSVRESK